MKTKILLLATSLLTASLFTPAQAQFPMGGGTAQPKALPGTAGDQSPKGTARITGSVVDSTQAKAIEFASIALYNKTTGKAVDGTVADDKGKFALTKLVAGDYRVLITFVGFRNKTIESLTLANGQSLDVGTIKLSSSTKTLDEVTVTGQAAMIEEKVDRLVYNADKDITAKGGDATDILRKVPLLTVDLDGNVSLRGSQNIRVLINNKPSTIIASSVADALKQIPADQIKTVEVITSPSAKYDAEGSGGIINIITKKNSLQGLNLNVDSGVGNRGSLLSLNGGYRKGKAGFTLGGFGRAMYNTITKTSLEQTSVVGGVSTLTRQTGDGDSRGLFGQYNLGFDYDLAKNQSLTAGVRYGVRNMISQQDLVTRLFTNGTPGSVSNRNVESKNLSGTVDMNLDYLHTFKPQQEWSISTLYSRNDLTNNFDADLLNGSEALTGRQRNLNKNVNQEFTLQTDYQTPIKKNQLIEFGAKGIFREVNSDYQYLLAGPTGGFTTENNGTLGSLLYHQNIAAGYTSYTYTTKKRYTLKGGLRYEHTFIDASTKEDGPIGIGNYGVLVPSLNASKTIKGTTVKLAYNRRIQRPGLQQLNPNFNAANPQNITIGNPALRPELTNNFELGLSKTIKKTFVNATFFGRVTNNAITQIREPSDTLVGAIVTTYQNIGRQYTYGTNTFANVAITSKINVGVFLNFFYTSLTGQTTGVDGLSQELTNTGFNLSGGSFASAQFKNGWGAQAFGFMQGTQVQLQGTQGGFGFYTVGVKKEFANKKGSVGLAAENFLTSRFNIHTVLNSPQFNQVNDVYLYNRGVRVTFTYKIGKMTMDAPRKKAKSVNNDDVKSDGAGQAPAAGGGGTPRQ
ncbi:TonB-dependent receptor domain-containing protein [Spirosoma utsteinense]|uniref:Outer membrane receptor protein involved in Fe transport n=1 Tax=Spirosoma utsteinense TaxID=2585773 RepID=A0ABR6WDV4_9BACT|nr:TonB-dependent receptor [Spirosoma utsteinense]MBC3788725.1 outer membrane receptor protein involved in Fe transport [Spirosoma utsteinense]MBC3794156.1 outer membrane receptor protein involved in Fe transport [Spirosoma utsteinense]